MCKSHHLEVGPRTTLQAAVWASVQLSRTVSGNSKCTAWSHSFREGHPKTNYRGIFKRKTKRGAQKGTRN